MEKIYVVTKGDWEDIQYAEMVMPGGLPEGCSLAAIDLHRPDLRPIYGGPTLTEALWGEMDRLMEGLMTGTDAEDGGDKFRAAELAWVLAITSNPYEPSVEAIRAETMQRWNQAQAEADAQEEALNPDEQEDWTESQVAVYSDQLSGGSGDEFA